MLLEMQVIQVGAESLSVLEDLRVVVKIRFCEVEKQKGVTIAGVMAMGLTEEVASGQLEGWHLMGVMGVV